MFNANVNSAQIVSATFVSLLQQGKPEKVINM